MGGKEGVEVERKGVGARRWKGERGKAEWWWEPSIFDTWLHPDA